MPLFTLHDLTLTSLFVDKKKTMISLKRSAASCITSLLLLLSQVGVWAQDLPESTTRILTIGDDLVIGSVPGGFRAEMFYKLIADGYNVDMIGTQTSNPYSNEMDPDHEGYNDKNIIFFDDEDYVNGLVDLVQDPDIVIAYAGTKDFIDEIEIPMVIYRYASLLERLADAFPHATIIASTLLGGYTNSFIDDMFNYNLNDRVYELNLQGKKVIIADVASEVSPDAMIDDSYLPTQEGYDVVGRVYAETIESAITPNGSYDDPVITDAINTSSNKIKIFFSKPLADESVDSVINFELDYGLEVFQANLLASKRTIVLKTSDFSQFEETDAPMKVTILQGVKDRTGLELARNSFITFILGRSPRSPTVERTPYPTLPPQQKIEGATLPPAISSKLPLSKTRILPLGDMLTVGEDYPGGYRNHLFDLLVALGYNAQMLGTRTSNPGDFPLYHEGWERKGIDFFFNLVEDFVGVIPDPDVVLLHVGMVDIIEDENPNDVALTAVYRLEQLILKIHEILPFTNIIATNLIEHQFPDIDDKVQSLFNDAVKDQIDSLSGRGVKVTFLDLRSALAGVNPPVMVKEVNNDLALTNQKDGYVQMAASWMTAMVDVIGPHGDNSAPEISRVEALDSYDAIEITFSKPISDASTNKNKFVLEYDIEVEDVELDDEKRVLTLSTSNFIDLEGAPLTLRVKNNAVHDRTSEKRALKDGTTFTFQIPPLKTTLGPSLSPAGAGDLNSAPSPPTAAPTKILYRTIIVPSKGKGKKKGKKKGKGKKKKWTAAPTTPPVGSGDQSNNSLLNNGSNNDDASDRETKIVYVYQYQYGGKGKGKKKKKHVRKRL